ncbi:hypothetical protein KUCAC02_021886, partial [Chaenocephalus aceratus]
LTPKETPDNIKKTQDQENQQRKESSGTQVQTILDNQPQILQKPPSIFPRRGRIKMLKKHQGIPTECVKKKCTPFQVSPLSGSTRLLQHHQKMFGDGINTLHPTAKKLRTEQNHRTPDYLKVNKVCRIKFRNSRTFANKDGSIQVTKHWKENYDFDLDSKFTNDSKDRTIIRALHGPWDFSIEDTSEEVRLIVHMWIGLFYSRSTDRFFNIDLCPEKSDSLEMSCGMVSATAQPELKVNSLVPLTSVTKTADPLIPNAMDLSKKDDSVLRQGSVILDLSMRNSSAEIVTSDSQNRMKIFVSSNRQYTIDTLNPLKSSAGQQKTITTRCYKKMVQSTMIVNEMNDFRSTHENMTTSTPLQKDGTLEHNVLHIFQGDGTYIPAQEMKLIFFQPENDDNAPRIGHLLFGCKNDKSKMIDGICNSEATGISLIEKHGKDFYKSVRGIEVDLNKKHVMWFLKLSMMKLKPYKERKKRHAKKAMKNLLQK